MKQDKLYKMQIALNGKEEISHWSSQNVVAKDVPEALRRVKLPKGGFVEAVELVAFIDVR